MSISDGTVIAQPNLGQANPATSVDHIIGAPLDELLAEHNAQIVEITSVDDPRFFGWLVEKRSGDVILAMPAGRDTLERDCSARMLLAQKDGLPLGRFPSLMTVTDIVKNGVDVLGDEPEAPAPTPSSCPDWCVTDHAVDTDPGWHQGPTASVTLSAPGLNSEPGEPAETPLSACVTQHNEDPAAFGIETRIWLDTGLDTTELDVAQTDQLIAGLEEFLPKLRAMRNHLVEASAGDHPGDPLLKAARMAEVDARVKAINEVQAVQP